ncbi:hypothetical protein [Novosphingobium sp.]|uniref:hypothetical protein n=1 Tax=Novosphingobium sp. TaxID=1874826 RepID=UPI00273296E2|nr:hypothetical protein [Novosphingobium sp.]MDP3906927.1 hypothetical protein [Novosphingobium sp.]
MSAAHSISLEFPLQYGPDDNPAGYTKVEGGKDRSADPAQLISALVLCGPAVSWIEKTSHSAAIIMPSEKNVIWQGSTFWHPNDKDIIACIKSSAGQPFFYRELPRGIETYKQ